MSMVQTVQENIGLSAVPFSKRGVGHKIAVPATPTARTFVLLISPSFTFINPVLFSHQGSLH